MTESTVFNINEFIPDFFWEVDNDWIKRLQY